MLTTLQAVIIDAEATGEHFVRIHCFDRETGYRCVLFRVSRRQPSCGLPDLFDQVETVVESRKPEGIPFVKELKSIRKYSDISRSFRALECASHFCRTIRFNCAHCDAPETIHTLLLNALQAWENTDRPNTVWLKALYKLASDEGFPVKKAWWMTLEPEARETTSSILRTSTQSQSGDDAMVLPYCESLIHWLETNQDFRF